MEELTNKKTEFLKKGYLIRDNFFTKEQCSKLLSDIKDFENSEELPVIHRESWGSSDRPLHRKIINGSQVKNNFQELESLYRDTVNEYVCDISNLSLVPLKNELVGANVNITPSGGSYPWHYDRNLVTVLIYLNEVNGGELELYPLYRITAFFPQFPTMQKLLDSFLMLKPIRFIFGRKVIVKPTEGKMIVMVGSKCLHSVKPVIGSEERVTIILSYDVLVNQEASNDNLDNYLYSQVEVSTQ